MNTSTPLKILCHLYLVASAILHRYLATANFIICPVSYQMIGPVCGTDGITYSSICELEAARLTTRGLEVAQLSPCSKYCGKNWDPLCGTDLVTYANHCTFSKAVRQMPNLKVFHIGQCMSPFTLDGLETTRASVFDRQDGRQFGRRYRRGTPRP